MSGGQLFVVNNPKTGATYVFDNHDTALQCRRSQKLNSDHLWGCIIFQAWKDGPHEGFRADEWRREMSNVTDFPTEPKRDLVAEMKGPENMGNAVLVDGRLIRGLVMFDRGDEIEFVLDHRLGFSFPRELAYQAASFASAAMAIGAGFAHFTGKHFTQREYAPQAVCLGEMPEPTDE